MDHTFVCLGVPVVLVAGGTEPSQNPGIQTETYGQPVIWVLESKTVAKIFYYRNFIHLAYVFGGIVYTAQVHSWIRGWGFLNIASGE